MRLCIPVSFALHPPSALPTDPQVPLPPSTLLSLLESGEGRTLEFKQGLQRPEKLARTLSAFANTRGGILLIGIGDHSEILGAPHPPDTLRELATIARTLLTPALDVELSITHIESKPIVVCSVPLSHTRPHTIAADDGSRVIYIRAGSSNRLATPKALAELERSTRTPRAYTELELSILAWVAQRSAANVPATIPAYAEESHTGKQRVRSAFMALERAGELIGHGVGTQRVYRPT